MAKRKISKKTQREIEKVAKKHPWIVIVALILVVVMATLCVLHYKRVVTFPFLEGVIPQESVDDGGDDITGVGGNFTNEDIQTISSSNVSIHFLELGNANSGDCTLIKVGNTEVLIDAGSKRSSADTINAYLDAFCSDNVIEYVVATHAHEDHIGAFVGGENEYNGVLYTYQIGTLIQFSKTNSTSKIYQDYVTAVNYLQDSSREMPTKVYTALDCWNNENGASRSFDLGQGVSLNILYQKYYEMKSSDENNYSVCTLLKDGTRNYLFTGDLEEEGETSLVESNILPKCALFKGGHHGSPTSSNTVLLEEINPDMVCVCCCGGNYKEYQYKDMANVFPSQAFVDRVSVYTDAVYVTTQYVEGGGFTSMNGNIVVYVENGELKLRCSNNATKLKDTDWFKQNRVMPNAWK